MRKLVEKIKEEAIHHASIPFWSWNDKLDKEELCRQIRNMKDMKMQGFFMHARSGLETEYLSTEWYECIKACVEEGRRLGMMAWSYDENGWPSGFAGGELLLDEDNHAVYLDFEWLKSYPATLGVDTLAVYAFDKNGIPHVVSGECNTEKYLRIFIGSDSSYVDTMRADITDKFIAATHEEYKRELGSDFGKAMPGFFTDEPQYYRWKTPYSRHMEKWFFEEYGYSVKEAVPALFCDYDGAREHRYDYHRLTSKKFRENFCKRLYDWHEKNGALLTGHFVEEQSLAGQVMCCGDIMPLYMYEHIPGVDYLGRELSGDLSFKQLGSVAAQTGKKTAMSEMFAAAGWDVTPRELRKIAELQYAGGVNLMCQHLYPYSIRGQRKRDYPAFYSEHNVWQSELHDFNEYFNNLGAILSLGEELADTLVIHPMHTAWLDFKRIDMKNSVAECDKNLSSLLSLLSDNGIGYHLGSEILIKDMGGAAGDVLTVGKCRYKRVIIPAADTLDLTTVELLQKFRCGGGKIYTYMHHLPTRIDGRVAPIPTLAHLPDLTDVGVLDKIWQEGDVVIETKPGAYIRSMTRNTEFGRLVFITNLGERDEWGIKVLVKRAKALGALDVMTLEGCAVYGSITELGAKAEIHLRSGESIVLYEDRAPEFLSEPNLPRYVKLTEKLIPKELPENLMTLDRAYVSKCGEPYGRLMPIEEIREELLSSRFCGKLTLAFPFNVTDIPEKLEVIAELNEKTEIKVNKKLVKIDGYAIDRSFSVGDIAPYIKCGENLVELTLDYYQRDYVYYVLYGGVSESLRNCLVFDTEIECVYLRGSFALDMAKENFDFLGENSYRYDAAHGMSLIAQRPEIDIINIVTDGYAFFAGSITFVTKLNYKSGDPTVLRLSGRYSTASVRVGGNEAGKLVLSECINLAPYLQDGENTLEITITNNYRNLFGPHHNVDAESLMVRPRDFTFEGEWKNGECERFRSDYSFIRFGLDL